jgi:hypothetical protein
MRRIGSPPRLLRDRADVLDADRAGGYSASGSASTSSRA